MDTRFTVAAHVLGYLAWQSEQGVEWVSSDELGRSINTHSVVVRRLLTQLQKAGLIETRRGASGGSRLARPASAIHLGEVFDAVVESGTSLISFPREVERDECQVGEHIEAVLREVIAEAEAVFRRNLGRTSVAEFSQMVVNRMIKLGICCPSEKERQPAAAKKHSQTTRLVEQTKAISGSRKGKTKR